MVERGVAQVEDHLDALVDVALHPIGAAEIDFRLAAVAEDVDAAVSSRNRPITLRTRMRLLRPRTPGAKRAGSAHDELDLHARLRGFVQGVDDFFVEQRIHFRDDEQPGRAGFRIEPLSRSINATKFLPRFSGATNSGV